MIKNETVIIALALVGEPQKEVSKRFLANPKTQEGIFSEKSE